MNAGHCRRTASPSRRYTDHLPGREVEAPAQVDRLRLQLDRALQDHRLAGPPVITVARDCLVATVRRPVPDNEYIFDSTICDAPPRA